MDRTWNARCSRWAVALTATWLCACASPGSAADTDTGGSTTTTGPPETGTPDSTAATSTSDSGSTSTGSTTTSEEDLCGDRIIQAGEHCDDGDQNGEYGKCKEDCSALGARCGDGEVNGPEPCDDGNGIGHDTCTNDCSVQACGDGTLDPGELCFELVPDVMSVGDPLAVLAVDLDMDADLDLAVLDAQTGTVVVLAGDGTGAFTVGGSFGAAPTPTRMAAGRFDAGTTPDVVTVGDGVVRVLLGDGAAGFMPLVGETLDAVGVGVGDLDGSGVDDLALTTVTGVATRVAAGDGTFAEHDALPTDGFDPDTAAVALLDGDDLPDVAAALDDSDETSTVGIVRVYLGGGDGSLTPGQDVEFPDDADGILALKLDGDDVTDLAVLRRGPCLREGVACVGASPEGHPVFGEITILGGVGDGTFEQLGSHVIGVAPRTMAAGDLNADGNVDLVAVHRSYRWITALLGDGDGGFVEDNAFDVGFDLEGVAVGDLDGDGVDDIAFTHRDAPGDPPGVRLLLSNP